MAVMYAFFWFVFFFQAEDGIRDGHVTGVQTCALPIFKGFAQHPRVVRVQERGARRARHLLHLAARSEEHTSELQSRGHLVCRLLLEKKKKKTKNTNKCKKKKNKT